MSETASSRAIRKALEDVGCIVIRVQAGTIFLPGRTMHLAAKGTPDMVVLDQRGRTTWLESKTPSNGLSPEQKRWHERARRMGHRVATVRNSTEAWEAVRS